MNYSDEFDVTSSSEASVEDSMDKEQLKLYLSRGEKRLEATNKLLGEARNAILQLQSQHLDSREVETKKQHLRIRNTPE
nr:unnamed protein product [Naegleria fowleri]